ncbi:hypothetical protein A3Q56_04377 [Intoshia linei]|uniref:Importin subunit beta-1/Transportin-1-like TPR repeats domain-containing protein n=1 Tax=Intoshia linei TaxID=1819745 RepID=A0A177B2N7_9BILA|nr:hypothetical protein A3Q56_04377 [Intoshia linei]
MPSKFGGKNQLTCWKFLPDVLFSISLTTYVKLRYDLLDTESTNEIREGCLEAFTGIMNCIKSASKNNIECVNEFQPYLHVIFKLIEDILKDDYRTDTSLKVSIGLIGDMCNGFGNVVYPYMQNESILDVLRKSKTSADKELKSVAVWASKEARKLKAVY